MSGWIKVEKSLENDPRVLRMTAQLRNADVTLGKRAKLLIVGAIVKLWWYADTHIREDNQLDLGVTEIDDLIGLDGFCALMPEDWLKVIDERTIQLPDFQEHNGVEAKRRAVTQKRVSRFRNAPRVTTGNALVTQGALPDQTRPDHINTPAKKKGKKTPLPENWTPSEGCVSRLTERHGFRNGDAERYIEAFRDACKAKGYTYIDFDAAFSNCVRQDWPKFRNGARTMPKQSAETKPSWS